MRDLVFYGIGIYRKGAILKLTGSSADRYAQKGQLITNISNLKALCHP